MKVNRQGKVVSDPPSKRLARSGIKLEEESSFGRVGLDRDGLPSIKSLEKEIDNIISST